MQYQYANHGLLYLYADDEKIRVVKSVCNYNNYVPILLNGILLQ
jgi:hypothetical protein